MQQKCAKGKGHSYAYECPKGNGWHLTSMKPQSHNVLKFRKKAIHIEIKKVGKDYDIYYQSSMGIDLPKSPYIGQVHHDFDLKKLLDMKKKLQN